MTLRGRCITVSGSTASLLLLVGLLPQQTTTVTSEILLKADLRAIDFVGQLIEVGVPAGIEVLGGSGLSDRTAIVPLSGRQTVPVTQIIDAFNRRHSESRAEWRDGAVVVRPIQDRSWLLDADVSLHVAQMPDVSDGLKVVLSVFDGNVKPGGISAGPMPMGPSGKPLYTPEMLGPIDVPGGRMTVLAAFNAIVRQRKGHAWVVMTEKQLGVTVVSWVGVLRREGSLAKIAFNDPKRPRL